MNTLSRDILPTPSRYSADILLLNFPAKFVDPPGYVWNILLSATPPGRSEQQNKLFLPSVTGFKKLSRIKIISEVITLRLFVRGY